MRLGTGLLACHVDQIGIKPSSVAALYGHVSVVNHVVGAVPISYILSHIEHVQTAYSSDVSRHSHSIDFNVHGAHIIDMLGGQSDNHMARAFPLHSSSPRPASSLAHQLSALPVLFLERGADIGLAVIFILIFENNYF